jgi:hypothetical protein
VLSIIFNNEISDSNRKVNVEVVVLVGIYLLNPMINPKIGGESRKKPEAHNYYEIDFNVLASCIIVIGPHQLHEWNSLFINFHAFLLF